MLHGGCHCGAVRFESEGKEIRFLYCHCPDCRKTTGSAFASVLVVEDSGFRVVAGLDRLIPYASSPGKQRCFCRLCGSHVFSRSETRPGLVLIRAGTLDDAPALRPQGHIWVSAKAPWHTIADDLPQHAEWPPPASSPATAS